jgi:broad specificity phosphatase PhoE
LLNGPKPDGEESFYDVQKRIKRSLSEILTVSFEEVPIIIAHTGVQ